MSEREEPAQAGELGMGRVDNDQLIEAVHPEQQQSLIARPHAEPPYLRELVHDNFDRSAVIRTPDQRSVARGDRLGDSYHEASEREYITHLYAYLQQAADLLKDDDSMRGRQIKAKVEQLLNSLVYVGEKELEAACGGMAEHWKSLIEAGGAVTIMAQARDNRSSGHVTLLAGEAFDALTHDNPELQAHLHIATANIDLAEQAAKITDGERITFAMVDDYSISGHQMQRQVQSFVGMLEAKGLTREQILPHIEVATVAQAGHTGASDAFQVSETDGGYAVPAYGYYLIPDGSSRPSITSSHSSTDYGYEFFLEEIDGYLKDSLQLTRITDLPTGIIRPYDENDQHPARPDLEERWSTLIQKYGDGSGVSEL